MNLIEEAKIKIDGLLNEACRQAIEQGELPEGDLNGKVEIPKDNANGDLAANHAMTGARVFHQAPKKIADTLVSHIDLDNTWFTDVQVAGPGFINFRFNDSWYAEVLKAVDDEEDHYGDVNLGNGQKLMVEFVSANPTGPMHMGNARGGVLGDALAAVMEKAGYDVWREFYVNDAGNQVEKFAKSIHVRYLQLINGEDSIEFPEDGYHGDDIKDLAKKFREKYGDEYADKSEKECHEVMARFGLDNNIPKMKEDLKRYGIEYDEWFLESGLHESDYVKETVDKLTELGFTYEKEDALWLKTTEILTGVYKLQGKSDKEIEKLDLKDDVLRRANGFYTYFAADIAYHRNKIQERGFDKVINVWGADHHGHVARLKGALDALGLDGQNRLVIVLMQLVKLMKGSEVVKMSKRTGKAISLTDLLDEVPVDAARYFFNSRPESTVEFDLDLAVRQDSENPVYYVQYAHARICTMIENLKEDGYTVPALTDINPSVLKEPQEMDLIRAMAELPEEIIMAATEYDPSRINKYVTALAAKFHKFYTACHIKGAEPELLKARLLLADEVRRVIEISLNIIGVTAPEKM